MRWTFNMVLLCFVVLSIQTNNKYKYKNSHFSCTTKRKTFFSSPRLLSFFVYTFAHKMVKRGKTFVRSLLYEKYAQILIQTKLHAHSVFIYGNCYLLNGWICTERRIPIHGSQWQPNLRQGWRWKRKTFLQAYKQADVLNWRRRNRNKLCMCLFSFASNEKWETQS